MDRSQGTHALRAGRNGGVTGFAVVLPLYNKADHIERALRSIRSQTLPPREIIVVDDGSTDGGRKYVRSQADVRLLERPAPGAGGYAARNLAIRAATQDWIAFLDADDAWSPDHLSSLSALSRQAPEDLVLMSTSYQVHLPGGKVIADPVRRVDGSAPGRRLLNFADFLDLWLRAGDCPVWTSAIAAKRTALHAAGLFPQHRCERGGDKDLWLRLAQLGTTAIGSHPSATYYRDSSNMVTGRNAVNRVHCIRPTIQRIIGASRPHEASLAQKVLNLEIRKYSFRSMKHASLSREAWSGFHAKTNPVTWAVLWIASHRYANALFHLAVLACVRWRNRRNDGRQRRN